MDYNKLGLFLKSLMIGILCLGILSACNSNSNSNINSKGETPEQSVSNAFNKLKVFDESNLQKYFTYDELMNFEISDDSNNTIGNTINDKKNAKLLFSNLDYKIKSSSVSGNTATVKTEITNLDFKSIMSEYMSQIMDFVAKNGDAISEEQFNEQIQRMLVNVIANKDNKKVTTTIDVKVTKQDSYWKIQLNKELQDALTGGLRSFCDNLDPS